MGFAKYEEDNIKINEDTRYFLDFDWKKNDNKKKIEYPCFDCKQKFESPNDRNDHLKTEHNTIGPVLFVNGIIIKVNENNIPKLESIKIFLFESNVNNTTILVNDTVIDILANDKDIINSGIIDITNETKKLNKNLISIVINETKYDITVLDNIKIDSDIVKSKITDWESLLQDNKRITKDYPAGLNPAEEKYLDGFFNYFIACQATDHKDKECRYNEAFGILSKFDSLSHKVRLILKVISFRLNWIESLVKICKNSYSIFDKILTFYDKEMSLQNSKNQTNESKEENIWIEQDTQDCMQAIIDFLDNKMDKVEEYLDRFFSNGEFDDSKIKEYQNLKDRVYFLKCKQHIHNNEYNKAKQYSKSINDPNLSKLIKQQIKES